MKEKITKMIKDAAGILGGVAFLALFGYVFVRCGPIEIEIVDPEPSTQQPSNK